MHPKRQVVFLKKTPSVYLRFNANRWQANLSFLSRY